MPAPSLESLRETFAISINTIMLVIVVEAYSIEEKFVRVTKSIKEYIYIYKSTIKNRMSSLMIFSKGLDLQEKKQNNNIDPNQSTSKKTLKSIPKEKIYFTKILSFFE